MLNFRGAKEIHEKLGFFVGMTYLDDVCKSNIQSDNILWLCHSAQQPSHLMEIYHKIKLSSMWSEVCKTTLRNFYFWISCGAISSCMTLDICLIVKWLVRMSCPSYCREAMIGQQITAFFTLLILCTVFLLLNVVFVRVNSQCYRVVEYLFPFCYFVSHRVIVCVLNFCGCQVNSICFHPGIKVTIKFLSITVT